MDGLIPRGSRMCLRRYHAAAYGAFIVLLLSSMVPSSPAQDRTIQTEYELARHCAETGSRANVLSRSLVNAQGQLTKFDDESLYLKKNKRYVRILYRDVLSVRCRDRSVNHIPDPSTRPHGAWRDINQVYPGTGILVVLSDGSIVKGLSNSATETHIIIFDRKTKARRDIERESVSAFYGLLGARGGVKAGASKGTEGALPSQTDPLFTIAGAGIGAIIGAITKTDGRPILIYSR